MDTTGRGRPFRVEAESRARDSREQRTSGARCRPQSQRLRCSTMGLIRWTAVPRAPPGAARGSSHSLAVRCRDEPMPCPTE
jgi:hypothetical protein